MGWSFDPATREGKPVAQSFIIRLDMGRRKVVQEQYLAPVYEPPTPFVLEWQD